LPQLVGQRSNDALFPLAMMLPEAARTVVEVSTGDQIITRENNDAAQSIIAKVVMIV